jgi:hypothetical protein
MTAYREVTSCQHASSAERLMDMHPVTADRWLRQRCHKTVLLRVRTIDRQHLDMQAACMNNKAIISSSAAYDLLSDQARI